MTPLLRRGATLVAAATLGLGALASTPLVASAADPAYDAAPADVGATWLAAQLTGGIVHNEQYDFDDIGLTADIALGLAGLGGHDAEVASITDAIEPRAKDEWYTSTYEGVTTTYAGSLAKAVVLAQTAGQDATSFGGENLVTTLEARVATAPPITGRIEDDNNAYGDSNVIGQAFAAEGLAAAGSLRAADATAYLLEQQCSEGYFRLDFTADKTAPDQTCDGGRASGDSASDTDVTALAVLALSDVPGASAAVADAEQWLIAQQKADGSFGGGTSTTASNTNSTGLAGWALGTLGDTDEASAAASWVRQRQAANVANCVYYAAPDLGAIAYDTAARDALQSTPITADTQDQFRRATAQALPVLRWAPGAAGDPQVLFTAEYVKAGSRTSVGVLDAAPGESLCAMLGEQSVLGYADRAGEAHLRVLLPRKTAVSKVRVANASGTFATAKINALGAKKLPLSLKKKRVAAGAKQVIRVRGLAPGESASVSITWPSKAGSGSGEGAAGQANRKGVFVVRVKAPHRTGRAKVVARGAFGNRRAHARFTVTR